MKIPIRFTKMSGAGNDFILIDNRDEVLQCDKPALARALCSRHFGIGGDGLLLVEASSRADFAMQYYNADGSYGGMCGNGGRCIARYAHANGIVADKRISFEALGHIYHAEMIGDSVKLQMKESKLLRSSQLIKMSAGELRGHFIDTGSPHIVIESSNLNGIDVESVGREIRQHDLFSPEGTNVNFIHIADDKVVNIRTYERGVEAETLACGTGSVAAGLVASSLKGLQSPVRLRVRSGEELKVYFTLDNDVFINVYLEGSAHILFSGDLAYDSNSGMIFGSTPIHSLSAAQR